MSDLEQRIAELEKRVRDLEARPVYVPVPYFPPQPYVVPGPYRAPWESPWYVTSTDTTVTKP